MLSRMSVADQLRAVAGVERSATRIIGGNGWVWPSRAGLSARRANKSSQACASLTHTAHTGRNDIG
jgi:hypothetical protein